MMSLSEDEYEPSQAVELSAGLSGPRPRRRAAVAARWASSPLYEHGGVLDSQTTDSQYVEGLSLGDSSEPSAGLKPSDSQATCVDNSDNPCVVLPPVPSENVHEVQSSRCGTRTVPSHCCSCCLRAQELEARLRKSEETGRKQLEIIGRLSHCVPTHQPDVKARLEEFDYELDYSQQSQVLIEVPKRDNTKRGLPDSEGALAEGARKRNRWE
ncbi:hypothetical protein DAEQUDRAFT_729816 [Daedalea quercina L-15889]|uniref:Uncharacterized protein n=1 Tax=Daedalea quercina L-15889 TaxID=1314783 RepID=A0A165NDW5_9APHY|nr:hypothetical protein DAEQUDRAFT_729816 [Daedalea quercina L-15889]